MHFESVPSLASEPSQALARIYRDHWRFVNHVLARYGVAEAAREDAAQEVFLIAQRRLATIDAGPGRARSWLYGVARRVAATRRRALRRRAHHLAQLPRPTPPSGPDEQLDEQRRRRAVCEAIAALEGLKREVFELVIEERSGPEIAEILGLPLNTVYSRLRLARSQIRRSARDRLAA